jgi:Transposase DDE domain group 1
MNTGIAVDALAAPARTAPACPPRAGGLPGTLAAAGTIPGPPMNALAILVISAGYHPANHRSAIPARAYERGSGHGHDAAPAGHPHPQRSPPAPGAAPRTSCPDRPYHRLPPARVKGACGVAKTSAPRPFDPRRRSHDRGSYQGMGPDSHAPKPRTKSSTKGAKPARTRLRICKDLTWPLHMRRQLADLELRRRRRARCEDRIRCAKDTGLRNLPLQGFDQNQIWCELVAMACELLAWMQMLAFTGPARRWEAKRLRLCLFPPPSGWCAAASASGCAWQPLGHGRSKSPPPSARCRPSHLTDQRQHPCETKGQLTGQWNPLTRRDSRAAKHGGTLKMAGPPQLQDTEPRSRKMQARGRC